MTTEFKPDPALNEQVDKEFVKQEYVEFEKPVYVKAADMMSDKGYQEGYLGGVIRARMKRENKRFWAGDNISDYVTEQDKAKLIDEATEAFETVLDRLLLYYESHLIIQIKLCSLVEQLAPFLLQALI